MFRKTVNEQKTRPSWNRGKLIGQKPPLKLKDISAIRVRLQLAGRLRDLALFNLAIDSKLRACDLVRIRIQDVCHAGRVTSRAMVMQQKTDRSVQFEITEQTRVAIATGPALTTSFRAATGSRSIYPGDSTRGC